jgi:ribosomal protein S21
LAGSPLSDRTYKEELYSARRFNVQGDNNSSFALSRFSNQFRKDGLVDEIRKRRQFTRPSVIRVRNLFASRQRRFNEMVSGTVNKILGIYESQKGAKK